MAGSSSEMPKASTSRAPCSTSPVASVTEKPSGSLAAPTASPSTNDAVGYAATCARAVASMAPGALPSCAKKPWECAAKRLRGAPASTMQTDRRARATYMAAESPAKLPPTMMASCRMDVLQVVGSAVGGEAAVEVGAQHGQRHLAEAREQQRLRVVERLVERGVHRLFDEASGRVRAVAHGEQRGT